MRSDMPLSKTLLTALVLGSAVLLTLGLLAAASITSPHLDIADRGPTVVAPGTRVETGDGTTRVEAPLTTVEQDASGTRVRAPFVDIHVPPDPPTREAPRVDVD